VAENKTHQPSGLFDLPDVEDGALGKMLRRELLLALIPFLFLATGSFIAIHHLPEGKSFVLESRGRGVFYDFISALALFIFFGFVWMAPSMWVRRSISIAYRLTFFLCFTVGLCWVEGRKYIAVVQTPDSFIFVRRFPLGTTTVPSSSISSVFSRKTSAIRAVSVTATAPGKGNRTLDCQRVGLKDQRTMSVMDELAAELETARGTSKTSVAPTTGARPSEAAR
jgi:hypothetical protein